jgi:TonB-dependent starch-binding outer membrane protein SusC
MNKRKFCMSIFAITHYLLTKPILMYKMVLKLGMTAVAVMLWATVIQAQFTATGRVTDQEGGPLIGASVAVRGTAIGTSTDLDGRFSLACPGTAATLEISYTGFSGVSIPVDRSSANLTISMTESTSLMDEVVVSGFATSVKRSNSANSVASISSAQLTGVTSQQTMDGALYGKFTGAEIRSNSGAPGGGMSVRLRGVTSVFLDQQPLYIIDGIYVDNGSVENGSNAVSESSAGGNASNQDDGSNRIADIDPEDIENIEILKGASAAAMYGSRAAGGVVIITTKRGVAGKMRVGFGQILGFNTATRLLGDRGWDAAKVDKQFGAADKAKFLENGTTDYEEVLYGNTGVASTTRLNVSGGDEKTTFFVGGSYKNETGIVQNTGYNRLNARMKVEHKINDRIDVSVGNMFMNTESDRGFFNNSNTNTTVGYALAFTKPWEKLEPNRDGLYPASSAGSNVLETVAQVVNKEEVNRYIGGITTNVSIIRKERSSLKLLLRAGLDAYTLRTTGVFPRGLSYFRADGTLKGVVTSGSTVNRNSNLQAFLIHTLNTGTATSFRTTLGLTQEDFKKNQVLTTGTQLNGSQTSLSQAKNIKVVQRVFPQQDKGVFAQEEFNYNDQFLATIGIRADKSSNNFDPNKLYYYPKANAAVNLNKFSFWTIEQISAAKVRVAYGQAGRFPGFDDKYSLFDGTSIGTQSGLYTSGVFGNPNIEPERQSELEYGVDLGFIKNRFNISLTFYNKKIDDLLLRQNLPTSTGFTQRLINGGALVNRGVELGITANMLNTKKIGWDVSVNWWKNQSEITRLDVPTFPLGGFAASLGQYQIELGKSATQIVGSFKNTDGTSGIKVYGNAEADFNMSLLNQVTLGNFDFNFLFHWKKGGDAINLSTLLWDLGGLTWDYDDKTLDPAGVLGNGEYRTSTWFAGNAGPWIEDAGYVRLREIGAFYRIPRSTFGNKMGLKVGVSGRNLINIFDYNSYDPEVSNFGNNVLANTVEVTPFPASRSINLHLNAEF